MMNSDVRWIFTKYGKFPQQTRNSRLCRFSSFCHSHDGDLWSTGQRLKYAEKHHECELSL